MDRRSTTPLRAGMRAPSASIEPQPIVTQAQLLAQPVAPPAPVGSPRLLSDVVRTLASFRRGLLAERKQKMLLSLQLEESRLQHQQQTSLLQRQELQLHTSVALSCALEHALQLHASGAGDATPATPATPNGAAHSIELENILRKSRHAMEVDLHRAFSAHASLQTRHRELESRHVSDRASFEVTKLQQTRELASKISALEVRATDHRKYQAKCQELAAELSERNDEQANMREEATQREAALRAEADEWRRQFNEQRDASARIQHELDEERLAHAVLAASVASVQNRISALETTVRHFTCTRILPGCGARTVGCEISIRRMALSGEVMLAVKHQRQALDASAPSECVCGASCTVSERDAADLSHEYMQDASTVLCRALDEDGIDRSPTPTLEDTEAMHEGALRLSLLAGEGGSAPGVQLGYRPRFLLCFTGDAYRCMVFESTSSEFRRHIADALTEFTRITKDQHMDELGEFFGDVRPTPSRSPR
jgi:hypothetical protein